MDDSQYCEFEDIAGDGFCDDEANIYSCNFDDGDCCGDFTDDSTCLQCQCWGMSGIYSFFSKNYKAFFFNQEKTGTVRPRSTLSLCPGKT